MCLAERVSLATASEAITSSACSERHLVLVGDLAIPAKPELVFDVVEFLADLGFPFPRRRVWIAAQCQCVQRIAEIDKDHRTGSTQSHQMPPFWVGQTRHTDFAYAPREFLLIVFVEMMTPRSSSISSLFRIGVQT